MTIDETYRLVSLISKKHQRGYISALEFDRAIRTAELYVFNDRYKMYAKARKVHNDLIPFIVETIQTPNVLGKVNLPTDYEYFLEAIVINPKGSEDNCEELPKGVFRGVSVRELEKGKVGYRIGSRLVKPDYRYPNLEIKDTHIQFYPHDLGSVQISYLRTPTPAKWAYTIVNNAQVYDAANSTDLEWSDTVHTEIVMQALIYLGVNLRDTELLQAVSELKQQETV